MNKSWFYLGAIGIAIVLTSCGDGNKPAATPSPSTSVTPATAPTAAVPTTPAPAAATPIVPTPVVAAGSPIVPGKPVSVSSAGLIPATNGENWAKTVNKGNADPFATLALQPVEAVEKDPITGLPVRATSAAKIASSASAVKSGVNKPLPGIKVASNPTQISKASGKSKIASKGSTSADTGITQDINPSTSAIPRTGINKPLPKIVVSSTPTNSSNNNASRPGSVAPKTGKIAANNVLRPVNIGATTSKTPGVTQIAARSEPVVAKPLQAMALEISGVIEVEGKTQVIVKLPNESFSRYIDVGSRVADGSILIKRVEGQESVSPTVVLEEVGVEVARKIGDKVAASTPAIQPKP
ncbi:hypothetical protein [Chamaesiphon sp. GL140_3_metabinner_50]|uniref:hypothetical protein n=1 Tax=Chamaesiphon sp. GL140_3_metabinner_50 TaxID=2970812 RepID=UPI0025D32E10|nr:hypothetical protein [Chamaesiphon sp. GL140_3_metabinner_50]